MKRRENEKLPRSAPIPEDDDGTEAVGLPYKVRRKGTTKTVPCREGAEAVAGHGTRRVPAYQLEEGGERERCGTTFMPHQMMEEMTLENEEKMLVCFHC